MTPSSSSSDPSAGVTVTVAELVRLQGEVVGRGFAALRPITSPLAGGYRSPFRGRGVEFEESRPYQPGDDVRNMDWRVTARTGTPHTKLFREERERPVFVVLDLNPGMAFGTRVAFKSVAAARAAAILAWSAAAHGDRVGGVLFGPNQWVVLRPAGRQRGVAPLLHAISAHLPRPMAAPVAPRPLAEALERVRRVARPGSLLLVLSDCATWDEGTEHHLLRLKQHHDLALVWVWDPLEARLPERVERWWGSDGQRRVLVSRSDARLRAAHADSFARRRQRLHDFCRQQGLPLVTLATDQAPGPALHSGLAPLLHQRRA